jgi:HEPN domain-containing protein
MHCVHELGKMAAELDPAFVGVSEADRLDAYYIPTRYPSGLPGGVPALYYADPKEASRATELARGVVALVERSLGT